MRLLCVIFSSTLTSQTFVWLSSTNLKTKMSALAIVSCSSGDSNQLVELIIMIGMTCPVFTLTEVSME